MLVVTFEGFCPMQTEDDVLYVCTPKGTHCKHEAAMVIRAEQIDINASSKLPDMLFVAPGGSPYFLYHLGGAKVSFGTPSTAPTYSTKADQQILDLGSLHGTCVSHPRDTFNQDGEFALNGGDVEPEDKQSIQLKRNGQPHGKARDTAERVQWTLRTGDLQILFNGRLISPVKKGTDVEVAVANTRPGPNGLTHFDLYYDLIKQHDGHRFQLEYAKAKDAEETGATNRTSPRYGNCVPPARLPL